MVADAELTRDDEEFEENLDFSKGKKNYAG